MVVNSTTYNTQNLPNRMGFNPSFMQSVSDTNQQGQYQTSTLEKTPSSDSLNLSAEKKQMSTGAKWGIGLGLAALATAGIFIATKGKKLKLSEAQEAKIKELIEKGDFDEKYVDIFKSTEHLSDDKFIKSVYKKLAKAMGYENYPPLEIVSKKSASSSRHGKLIKIDKLGFKEKGQLIKAIRHELEHFRQDDLIYRAFGRDAFFDSVTQSNINKLKFDDEFFISKMGKKYSELTKSEIDIFQKNARKKYETPESVDLFESILKEKGPISVGSAEYKEAERMLQATKDYVSPTALVKEPLTKDLINKLKVENPEKFALMQKIYKQYKTNTLETSANAEGSKIGKMYDLFKEIIAS